MSVQYFVNYNLSHGWVLTSGPILSCCCPGQVKS
jgi:iron only hydrogenase large subunit-like protein